MRGCGCLSACVGLHESTLKRHLDYHGLVCMLSHCIAVFPPGLKRKGGGGGGRLKLFMLWHIHCYYPVLHEGKFILPNMGIECSTSPSRGRELTVSNLSGTVKVTLPCGCGSVARGHGM